MESKPRKGKKEKKLQFETSENIGVYETFESMHLKE